MSRRAESTGRPSYAMIDDAIAELTRSWAQRVRRAATGRPQASHRRYRQFPPLSWPVRERGPQPRARSAAERDGVRALLNSPESVDKVPVTVYYELLDEGVYLASVPMMYRILGEDQG
jgi:putative transposase